MDSPGHIDFIFEVVSALKLSDGAVLVVDVIEGVATQTVNVMKRLIEEDIGCILLINKIDKLFAMGVGLEEIYQTIWKVVSKANATMNIFLRAKIQQKLKGNPDLDEEELMKQFQVEEYFHPLRDNVIFASVIHGWGFHLAKFTEMLAPKLKMEKAKLFMTLWGDYYWDPRQKKIVRKNPRGYFKRVFVQFILQALESMYHMVENREMGKLKNLNKIMGLGLPERLFNQKKVNDSFLSIIMNKWLPVETTVFEMIVRRLPNARQAQEKRIKTIIGRENWGMMNLTGSPEQKCIDHMRYCRNDSQALASVVISKYFLVPEKNILSRNRCEENLRRDQDFQGLGCLLYTSPSPRDLSTSRMPSSA